MHNNLIILAGGASSRMKNSLSSDSLSQLEVFEADTKSKSLIKLGKDQRSLMDYLLINAKCAGYENIYMVVGEKNSIFTELYGKENKHQDFEKLTIFFAIQFIPEGRKKPFGTADALSQTLEQYPVLQNTQFTVCNSDNLYSVKAFTELRSNKNDHALIAYDRETLLFSEERISKFAVLNMNQQLNLINIIEKPEVEQLDLFKDNSGKIRVSMNIFKFNGSSAFQYLKNCPISKEREEKEIPSAIINMLKDAGIIIKCIPLSEHVPDLTSKEDIEIMKKYLSKHFPTIK